MILVGCAELGEPDLGADPVITTTTVPGDQVSVGEEATDAVVEAPQLRDFAPPRPDGYIPSVVVSTEEGLFVWDNEADIIPLTPPAGTLAASRLVDDFFGGLVVQVDGPLLADAEDDEARAASQIWWYGAQGGEPFVLDDVGGTLLDVGFLDSTGAIHAFVSVDGMSVDAINLDGASFERIPFIALREGQSLLDLSASNGLHAAVIGDENCGDLLFYNFLGEQVDLGGPGRPACVAARRPTYGEVALNPDRSSVVFTQLTYRADGVVASTRVIARDLRSEAEPFSLLVGAAGERIHSLSFDGQRLAYIRSGPEGSTAEVMNPFGSEPAEILDVADPIFITFARQRLLVGRDSLDS